MCWELLLAHQPRFQQLGHQLRSVLTEWIIYGISFCLSGVWGHPDRRFYWKVLATTNIFTASVSLLIICTNPATIWVYAGYPPVMIFFVGCSSSQLQFYLSPLSLIVRYVHLFNPLGQWSYFTVLLLDEQSQLTLLVRYSCQLCLDCS